jgi:hypothetical protein
MSSRRFVPCAGLIIGLFGIGGQVFRDETSAVIWFLVAGFYISLALTIIVLRNRIAAWWKSSTLLPCGCAVLLLFLGVNALYHVHWRDVSPQYTNTSPAPRTVTSAGSEFISYRRRDGGLY